MDKSSSLGMPPRHPFFIGKNQVTFQDTIFLLLHAQYVFLGASVVLVFLVSLVLFAVTAQKKISLLDLFVILFLCTIMHSITLHVCQTNYFPLNRNVCKP
jgi:hypothetical protein